MRALLLTLVLATAAQAQGTGTLAGTVRDAATSEVLPYANVRVDGTTLGAAADADGVYRLIGIPVGTYTVTASFIGYEPQAVTDVAISNGYTRDLSFEITSSGPGCVIVFYEPPFFWQSPYTSRFAQPAPSHLIRDDCDWDPGLPRVPSGMAMRSGNAGGADFFDLWSW